MMVPWLTIFDFGTVRANFKKPIDLKSAKYKNYNFALLIPIFNDTKYLTNLDFLKKYSRHVILCTTTNETPEFMDSLEKLAQENGFRISYSGVGGDTKNPWSIYNKTLLAHDAVLKNTISQIKEEYVIFIDGDTIVDGELEILAGLMDDHKFDLASVKILPAKRTNLIEHLQGVEYDIAMQARLIYPWLTSGAGMIAKRKVMQEIMMQHSLFFNGGDIEIGKIADLIGYKVGHIPMVFYTDIPETFKKWVKQRFSWMCGCFRHSIVNIHHNLKHPFHFLYFSFIIYFLYPFKLVEMFNHWYMLPFIIALYALITYFANWKVRSKYMFIFPFYALFQVLVVIWFGIYRYLVTIYKTENIGLIRVKPNPDLIKNKPSPHLNLAYNYALIIGGVSAVMLGSNSFMQDVVFGRRYETVELIQIAANFTQKQTEVAFNTIKNGIDSGDATEPSVAGVSTEFNEEESSK